MEHWTDKLVEMKACPDAVAWARSYTTPEAAWEACERPDRMFWVASRLATLRRHHQAIVLAVADCAQTALKYVPAGEGRPLAAIEAAEKWALAPSEENRAAAGSAAWAAWKALGDKAIYVPAIYGQPIPEVPEKSIVAMVDISYSRKVSDTHYTNHKNIFIRTIAFNYSYICIFYKRIKFSQFNIY
mgnify:CR=1 FL=1